MARLIADLATEARVSRPQLWGDGVGETLRLIGLRLPARENRDLLFVDSHRLGGAERRPFSPAMARRLAPWICRDEPPDFFLSAGQTAATPESFLVRLPGAYLVRFGHVPVVVAADRRTVLRDLSSRYAPLLHFAPFDLAAALREAREVPGPVFLFDDDATSGNYSHWLLDALPRLAAQESSGIRDAVTVATAPLTAPYQRETLRLCGWDDARVLELAPIQALRAEWLLATTDQPQPPHPAFKAAPWAVRFLRRHLGAGRLSTGRADPAAGRRLYVSRGDAPGRRVLNEPALTAMLAGRGFEPVTLGGMSVAEQAALFDSAAWIVAPHGAALANLVFARPGTTVLELFPRSYGTPAYWVLAASSQLRYGCHVVPDASVVRREDRSRDDFSVDPEVLAERYGDLLPR